MKHPIYEQCENSIKQALDVLEILRQRRAITEPLTRAIRLRRRTADIAMQATFEELRHAFITPIDREDLLRLRQVAEAVVCCAEDAVITLSLRRQPTIPPDDTALLSAVTAECRHLQAAIESFAPYPRSNTILDRLTALERQHRKSEEEIGSETTGEALKKISAACFSAAEAIRYVLLKIS